MDLKDRIKTLRQETGISAPALAERLSKAESTVRTWETGRAKPDADTLMILAGIFDCSTDYLLGLSNIKNQNELDNILARINELDGLTDKQKSYLLWQLGAVSIRLKEYVNDDEALKENIINWLADILANYANMIYLPKLDKKTKKGTVEADILAFIAKPQAHRRAIEALNKLGEAIEKEFYNQNFATQKEG